VLLVFFGSYRALAGFWLYWMLEISRVNFMTFFFLAFRHCDATKLNDFRLTIAI
jgi:hypothetical protein